MFILAVLTTYGFPVGVYQFPTMKKAMRSINKSFEKSSYIIDDKREYLEGECVQKGVKYRFTVNKLNQISGETILDFSNDVHKEPLPVK